MLSCAQVGKLEKGWDRTMKRSDAPATTPVLRIDAMGILNNLQAIRSRTKAQIMAVVKNNGYGLGLCEYGGMLNAMGVERFAVGDAQEALCLRQAGTYGEILVLAPVYSQEEILELTRLHVSLQISSVQQLEALRKALAGLRETPKLHLKLDTGLGRWGFLPQDLPAVVDQLKKWRFDGVYTHFASPYGDETATRTQARRFFEAVDWLQQAGVELGKRHLCASGGTLRFPQYHVDMVRVGSALVGGVPNAAAYGLRPVARLEAPVALLKELKKGEHLGYGGETKLKQDSRVAVVAVGKREGLKTAGHSGRLGRWIDRIKPPVPLQAQLPGGAAPVLGGLGANHLMLDVSRVPCALGDSASFPLNPIYCPPSIRREWREVSAMPDQSRAAG